MIVFVVVPVTSVYLYQALIYEQPEEVPPAPVAIVFGAAIRLDGETVDLETKNY